MIEQYTIAATPKYNFPQPAMDTTLPQRLTELSLRSLKPIENQRFQLNQQAIQQTSNIEMHLHPLQLKLQPIPLTPKHEPAIVAAVDTSNMKIGETNTGTLIAIRAANVWKQNKSYHYFRLGPFIYHITEENKKQVYTALQKTYFNTLNDSNQNSPNLQQMPMRMSNLLERWLQKMLAKTITNGLILFDGSLTSGTPDTPIRLMKEILEDARKRSNAVLAFSKMTNLRFNGHIITDIMHTQKLPYLLQIDGIKPKPPFALFGDIYVARLTKGNYSFRLDIDKEIPCQQKTEAVEKLLGNDLLVQSYPETLRLAHILCTFTANEVIAMQHFVSCKCGLKIVNKPDMHRLLFGPYGRGDGNA